MDAAIAVKPTMSHRKIVTAVKLSGSTAVPVFNWCATSLSNDNATSLQCLLTQATNTCVITSTICACTHCSSRPVVISLHALLKCFLSRASMHSAILFYQFCPSVCLSNADTVSKRMDVSSQFLDADRGVVLSFFLAQPPLNL